VYIYMCVYIYICIVHPLKAYAPWAVPRFISSPWGSSIHLQRDWNNPWCLDSNHRMVEQTPIYIYGHVHDNSPKIWEYVWTSHISSTSWWFHNYIYIWYQFYNYNHGTFFICVHLAGFTPASSLVSFRRPLRVLQTRDDQLRRHGHFAAEVLPRRVGRWVGFNGTRDDL
jgi:hypothetical protein